MFGNLVQDYSFDFPPTLPIIAVQPRCLLQTLAVVASIYKRKSFNTYALGVNVFVTLATQ
jgi:hypothetical protein